LPFETQALQTAKGINTERRITAIGNLVKASKFIIHYPDFDIILPVFCRDNLKNTTH
jgi:hypothetical protein